MIFTTYNYDNNATVGRSGRFIRVADRIDNFLTITPKASLSYGFDNKNMIYVRAARGSRAPQVSDLYSVQQNQVAGEAEIETLDSLELGFKGKIGSFDTDNNGNFITTMKIPKNISKYNGYLLVTPENFALGNKLFEVKFIVKKYNY